ncbi:uncharacterized protein OCT59_026977 [Rhizophagus irregularis]|uniref:F-box domain-containing protein n=2 Tax=Rhizophagus irregularis TaxID=588596 RepID=U9U8U7_RHIID|nr:hypothetical protein GLOIN_2v1775357 [Rhizophagus irregularis DAOM 181602=DAOM 197198]EXX63060.1 hypothetical protein RirG_155890 [Rhizophagus irregularis DAOM 197198w]POG70939.1 hypothetical protein GLOIN_2v1775357 [Rhizophagus irregularis DAOM 181602=DAOM 197198]UZO06666.1 hypothetical protein OCT59_026977 [Rhizophagus irregularis]|eukprot:XP_025177805.1 hypothetical protein GLOIN_2v1775357 [Rhizophagus irregularis DAOM 181602=DAOM 197198]
MACSKIFSGELPEILSDIMQYFRNDFSTLHSCILVNRLWCHLAIPLLWENPFSIISRKNNYNIEYHKIRFIEIYLINLNDNDKIKLNEFGINHLIPLNTLFNYPSFIQHLDGRLIGDCIENWAAAVKKEKSLFWFVKNIQNSDFIKFIHKSLIEIFIENEANLYTFNVTHYHDYFDIVSESVLQNPHFIRNIKILYLKISTPLLKVLSSNCNSISSLYNPRFKDNTDIEYLSQLIKSQKNLKKICFVKKFPPILLNSNCLNTLNTIIFLYINFNNINILNEVFEQLNVLESVHIMYCYSLDSNFIQQIINLSKPFKLKSLFVDEIFESIELLLQKSGDYLENFGLSFEPNTTYYNDVSDSQLLEAKSQLLKLITRYCTKVKFFELIEFNNNQNIYLTFDLIESIKQNLNYLTIDINYDFGSGFNRDTELSSIVLQNLGQILPFKLEYLDLTLVMNTTDFEIFLINSQDTFIKKLLFSNIIDRTREEVRQDNLLYNIKDHIMEMKRVKYFAFQNHFTDDGENDEDLFHLIDEVKEYNIVIQNYNDLKIKFIEFLVD